LDCPLYWRQGHVRNGAAQVLSEVIATLGLRLVIALVGRARSAAAPYTVAAYIVGAYWFASSTSFATPAVHAGPVAGATLSQESGPQMFRDFCSAELPEQLSRVLLIRWLLSEKLSAKSGASR
jgi:hypothetical protein